MRKLGNDIYEAMGAFGTDAEQARIMSRACQVRDRYKWVLQHVYKDAAPWFLDCTNAVYITEKDGRRSLIVYVEESIVAAELNAQRELIRLVLLQMFGEDVDTFDIHVSRGRYKDRHPYREEEPAGGPAAAREHARELNAVELTSTERAVVEERVAAISDPRLRESVKKAMEADMKRLRLENDEKLSEN